MYENEIIRCVSYFISGVWEIDDAAAFCCSMELGSFNCAWKKKICREFEKIVEELNYAW